MTLLKITGMALHSILLLLLWTTCCHGYNIDLLSPLIVSSGLGADEIASYSFGFSFAHHTFSNGDKMLLVGAPKAQHNGLEEGGVYVCPLIHQGTCQRNEAFNSRENSFPQFFDEILKEDENVIGQMLGYSITSKNNRVLACAPMYVGIASTQQGGLYYSTNGRCITMARDFDNSTLPTQLFRNSFATAGVGTEIYRPSVTDDAEVYAIGSIRSEGSVPVSGGVYVLEVDIDSVTQTTKSDIPSTLNAKLQGFHVEQGRILQNYAEDLIASGPKALRHRGQIIVYRNNPGTSIDAVTVTGPESAIDGYFGYDFALVDLQTDSFDSLVVGCPLCNGDRGLVFVYRHTGNPANPINESDVQVISSPNSRSKSEFGTAVENVGDVDQDGYEDVAISAPYEDRGVVYLYRGGANGLITDDYQVIPAPVGTRGFGHIITARIDVDDNLYPDFTVGDLTKTSVYTFRSSPVINVTISTMETSYTLDYTDRNCELQGIPSICFVVTPCFSFSTMYGGVDRFAVRYTLVVDEVEQRVGLLDNVLTNRVTNETIVSSSDDRTCGISHTFVLVPDFSKLDPIPMSITITNAEELLPLPSADSALYGGDLHPIMSRASDGSTLDLEILPNYVQNCGLNDICDPVFIVQVNPRIPSADGIVPWASGFVFHLNVRLQNTIEDSLAAVFVINLPLGIQFINSESITDFAISSCERPSQQVVQCRLKNPILVNEVVDFRVFFRPDLRDDTFDVQSLPFNFTIRDTAIRGSATTTLRAQSVASYEVEGSFGIEEEQASRFQPSANQSTASLGSQGPTINYQVTVRHTGNDMEDSPIPSLVINIVWPAVLTVEGGEQLPLLIPIDNVIIGSDRTTCRQHKAIPNHLLSTNQQSPLVLPNITGDARIENCPNNVTCGIIQCEILDLPPQRSDLSTPPVQISIFSTLWSASIRDVLNISVYAESQSTTDYPAIIAGSVTNALTSIRLQPAVTETQRECFQLWIVVVSVLGGLVVAFFIVLGCGMCGFFGRGYYKKKREEEQRKTLNESHQTDGSLGSRIIPPPAGYRDSLIKSKEAEDEMDAHMNKPSTVPGTFAPYSQKSSGEVEIGEEEITNEVVMKTLPESAMPFGAEGSPDLETEI